jgi:succinate dehydrogenase / fumarate reductase cytochrome b subunit
MAVTGLALLAFVIGHMLGNLQIFVGREQLNAYAALLHSMPMLLWTARIGLLVMVGLHIWAAVVLTLENRRARPEWNNRFTNIQSSYASRTMRISGVIVLCFIIYHLLHFTVPVADSSLGAIPPDAQGRHDVYQMVINGFSKPLVSGFYILSMFLLASHLRHGVGSMLQTFGWRNSGTRKMIRAVAWITAGVVFIGNSAIPVAVLLGKLN